jgi:CheY-like chemotaxis protein/HPt (histidine-containing phosphotransfer) domain-containing protein
LPPTVFEGGTVLVVEDNDINREIATALLQRAGLGVQVATDGAEAVEAVRHHPFDLILMDVQMPRMDGLAATRAIRALSGAAGRVPIIAMTAAAMRGDRERCLKAGMSDYVSKPLDAPAFLATVSKWLSGAPQRASERPAPAASPGDFDPAAIEAIRLVVSGERLSSIVQKFVAGAAERVERLAGSEDLSTMGAIAHDLKSMFGNFGATAVQRAAEQLERACCDGDAAAARELVLHIAETAPVAWQVVQAFVEGTKLELPGELSA